MFDCSTRHSKTSGVNFPLLRPPLIGNGFLPYFKTWPLEFLEHSGVKSVTVVGVFWLAVQFTPHAFRSGLRAGQSGASRCSLSDCPCRCGCSIQVTTSSSKWTRYWSNSGLESKTQPATTCFTAARLLDSRTDSLYNPKSEESPYFWLWCLWCNMWKNRNQIYKYTSLPKKYIPMWNIHQGVYLLTHLNMCTV